MKIYLSKEQARIVEAALDKYLRGLKEQNKDNLELVEETIFQGELLATYFERQREYE